MVGRMLCVFCLRNTAVCGIHFDQREYGREGLSRLVHLCAGQQDFVGGFFPSGEPAHLNLRLMPPLSLALLSVVLPLAFGAFQWCKSKALSKQQCRLQHARFWLHRGYFKSMP